MESLKLNVYDENDNVIKTSEAKVIDLRFGTIRSLMELLKVDDINDSFELLKAVYGAWEQITKILGRVFPDMTDEDWENIKIGELVPILFTVLKSTFLQMLAIPSDNPKN